jgi:hypothetical protein
MLNHGADRYLAIMNPPVRSGRLTIRTSTGGRVR